MKLIATIKKSAKENIRNWQVILLVIFFSPFFVFLMKLMYGGGETVYKVGLLDLDKGSAAVELVNEISNCENKDGGKQFEIVSIKDKEDIKGQIKEKTVDVVIVIPEGYTEKLVNTEDNESAVAEFYGSMLNSRYTIAAIMAADIVYDQGIKLANMTVPATISETFMETKEAKSEFDLYVPGLISLSVLMILFTASASIVKENDKKTLVRLKLSRLGTFNYLVGESVVQAAISIVAIIIAYLSAVLLGYKSEGSFISILVVDRKSVV